MIMMAFKEGLKVRYSRKYLSVREVILSAGAIGSPHLLLLSGVGPLNELSPLHILVLHQQPHVGKFMADNPRNTISIVLPSSVNASYLQVVGITPDFYVESVSSVTPFASLSKPSSLLGNLSTPVNLSIASLGYKVPGPASYGFLSLASSADVRVSPNVQFNYFSDPMDRARCVKGLRKAGDMLRTNTLARFKFDKDLQGENGFKFFGPVLPVDYLLNTSSLENFCRRTTTTWWHFHGGCLVGKVVDGDFRVTGINALRVVDSYIFNFSPGTNPQATLMMMGRYAGLKMLQQRMD
ncbi:hypothetical protein TIFTF001_021315 [Ficus carica]|uniref:(R)-mandelonitrile lyase n=1 Tax=Ficus carica TaxID=3494 RepID=A0AA88AYS0_FICCA|nr:hypothetical protein TIFTF001_021315 [Ficus carica]